MEGKGAEEEGGERKEKNGSRASVSEKSVVMEIHWDSNPYLTMAS